MSGSAAAGDKFSSYQVCVIIPTFNNASKLAGVIDDVTLFTQHIIVVNDGSTDDTLAIVNSYSHVRLLSYEKNRGKGWALRQGFNFALSLGYRFAITIDSDGQHFAKDLPCFLNLLPEDQEAIIIGARNMKQASVPGKSSFGHKFSNFWFKVETGIDAPDTQSGYRLYPIYLLQNMQFITRKYEFEIEVLVRAAWKGIRILSVPVSVYYPPAHERITHFRPFKDFTRISILNTFLVLVTFLYIKPRDFFKTIGQKNRLRTFIDEQLLRSGHSDLNKSLSIAFGLFMGIVPIWGFQLVVAIFLAVVFRLNKMLVIIAANISIPPMIPLIIFLSYQAGAWWMGAHAGSLVFSRSLTLQSIQQNLQQYIYGSITLAIVAGITGGLLTFIALKLFKRKSVYSG